MAKEGQQKAFWQGVIAGVLVIAVLFGVYQLGAQNKGVSLGNNNPSVVPTIDPTGGAPAQPTQDASKVSVTKDDHVRGNANAKITMVEFSDFECPFCARFTPTVEQVLQQYGDDVKLVYKHFPLRSIHPLAQKAAEASECAADQGKFWEYHDELFAANNAGSLTQASFQTIATKLGLNTNTFTSCLDNGEKAAKVEADYQMGIAAGVNGTPGTFVNDQFIAGALPFAQVQTIIESQL